MPRIVKIVSMHGLDGGPGNRSGVARHTNAAGAFLPFQKRPVAPTDAFFELGVRVLRASDMCCLMMCCVDACAGSKVRLRYVYLMWAIHVH